MNALSTRLLKPDNRTTAIITTCTYEELAVCGDYAKRRYNH